MKYQHLQVYDSYASHSRKKPKKQSSNALKTMFTILICLVTLVGLGYGIVYALSPKPKVITTATNNNYKVTPATTNTTSTPAPKPTIKAVTPPANQTTACTNNTIARVVIVSISQRHMWACEGSSESFDSPVVTGDTNVAADATPLGTYKIYAQETNLYLNGSDSRGSWHDWVNYWMPFYDSAAYGIFGFHDATWRASTDFGNIDPSSDQASHGCVELPLGIAQQLYNWASVGTEVSIQA